MPGKEYYFEKIESEFASAHEALKIGNEGRARVCARRAVGHAIEWFLTKFPGEGWGTDAMTRLVRLREDKGFPEDIHEAAARLTARVSGQFTHPYKINPEEDARIIVDYVRKMMDDGSH
ncbi:MAG: hypothetical protein ABSF91_11755 [Bacteroidota bacterium]|jgi:HEPN domain-containing protein